MNKFLNHRPLEITGVYTVFDTAYEAGRYFPGEMHNFWECVCVLDGTAGVSADDRVYTLGAGEMIFHKPMEFHRIWTQGQETLKFFVVTFDVSGAPSQKLEDSTFKIDGDAKSAFEWLVETYREYTRDEEPNDACVRKWFENGVKMQIFCNALETFLLEICAEKPTNESFERTEQAKLFRHLVKTMQNHIQGSLTIKQLAAEAHTSETGVKRTFMKYCGISPHAYFLNLKLKEAYRLLEKGYRIGEISEKLGFDNPNYFAVVFKRMTGYSPQNYKKKFLR